MDSASFTGERHAVPTPSSTPDFDIPGDHDCFSPRVRSGKGWTSRSSRDNVTDNHFFSRSASSASIAESEGPSQDATHPILPGRSPTLAHTRPPSPKRIHNSHNHHQHKASITTWSFLLRPSSHIPQSFLRSNASRAARLAKYPVITSPWSLWLADMHNPYDPVSGDRVLEIE
jgi:hypothetical protein